MLSRRVCNPKSIVPLAGSIAALLLCSQIDVAMAQTSLWQATPSDNNFNNDGNWGDGAPNSPTVGVFGTSNVTGIVLTDSIAVGGLQFNGGASAFMIDTAGNELDFEGGVMNASGQVQTLLVNSGRIAFFNNSGLDVNTVISIDGGGKVDFWATSSAGAATLIAGGDLFASTIFFEQSSTGGTAAIKVWYDGALDVSHQLTGGVTIGSLAGNGNVFLGSNNLTVGSNNATTIYAGIMQDGGEGGGTGGSLTKIGIGSLTLTGQNTYTGNTVVQNGALIINGSIVSPVTLVNPAGTLGGTGWIGGNVYNTGNVQPGDAPGILLMKQNYVQAHTGTLTIEVAGSNAGQFSALAVQGQAAIAGDLRLVQVGSTPRLKLNESLPILGAGGGSSADSTRSTIRSLRGRSSITTSSTLGKRFI